LHTSEAPGRRQEIGRLTTDADHVLVIDSSTLRLGDKIVRLDRVVPAPRGDICRSAAGVAFDCGDAAATAMARMIKGRTIDCTLSAAPDGGWPIAVCSANGVEINSAILAGDWRR
jgi:hypothetical protein